MCTCILTYFHLPIHITILLIYTAPSHKCSYIFTKSTNFILLFHYHVFQTFFHYIAVSFYFQSFLVSALPVLPPSPISSIYVLPSSFQPHCSIVSGSFFTAPLLTLLTSSYVSALCFFLSVFSSLCVPH